MYKTNDEAEALAREIKEALSDVEKVEVAICPPFTALERVSRAIAGSKIALGAQNMFWEDEGAFTGEISPKMLLALKCRYVILGHSERRKYFKESDEDVNKKVLKAFNSGLFPILCVGETLEERDSGKTWSVVERQLLSAIKGLESLEGLVIAYEPVWAIGTGVPATGEDALEVISRIRQRLSELWGKETAYSIRVLYGGSVKPENIMEFMKYEDIDGALVGGASLKAEAFVGIVKKVIEERKF
ncbi:MAG: triosephosphate isomerase [bacterium]|nr:triosephosphate isomerase [bacterium]